MAKVIRTQGFTGAIWKIYDQIPLPHFAVKECPECKCHGTLEYIGFAAKYGTTLQAKMYQCRQCDTWLDCVSPRAEYRREGCETLRLELTREFQIGDTALLGDTASV